MLIQMWEFLEQMLKVRERGNYFQTVNQGEKSQLNQKMARNEKRYKKQKRYGIQNTIAGKKSRPPREWTKISVRDWIKSKTINRVDALHKWPP